MIRVFFILYALFIAGCESDYSKFERRVPHDYLAEYTTDIIVGRYIEFKEVIVPGESCLYHQEKIEVLDTIKGNMAIGDIITINGLTAHENNIEGSDHLLFLSPSKVESDNRNDPCMVELHREVFSSLIWCCALSKDGVVLYDMVNSEDKGENYFLSTKIILNNCPGHPPIAHPNCPSIGRKECSVIPNCPSIGRKECSVIEFLPGILRVF